MTKRHLCASLCVVTWMFVNAAQPAAGATYQVGPGKPYSRISDVPALAPGDVVEIASGTYYEGRRWTSSGTAAAPITIRGVGLTRPIVDGTGVDVNGYLPGGRALFQIEGNYVVVENIEFRNARNDSANGAGIRVLAGRSAVVRNVRITQCDMGVMANLHEDLLVEHSEIASNGALSGANSHNVYVGDGGTATFQFNYIHDAVSGQNFKSRSHFTQLLYNYIADSADGEIGLVDSDRTDEPHSNALMLGNVVVSSHRSAANNVAKFIDFGQDLGYPHRGVLYLIHNTLVAGMPEIEFLWATSPQGSIVAEHNIFIGSNTIAGWWVENISGARNWMPASAAIPPAMTTSYQGAAPGFIDPATRNFRPAANAAVNNLSAGPSLYFDGQGLPHSALPQFEYASPMQAVPRVAIASYDLGAYESGGGGAPLPPPGGTPPPPGGTPPPTGPSQAVFVEMDTTTQGAWLGTYGTQGYALAADVTSLPAGASVSAAGQGSWMYSASTTDPRALQRPTGGSFAATWYSSRFTIDVNTGDGGAHRVALYFMDFDDRGRVQSIDVLDPATGALLDTRTASTFVGGVYGVWNVTGAVRFRVTAIAGVNAVTSAVFIDPAGAVPLPTASARFVGTDPTTQGTWRGVYGTGGYMLAAEGGQPSAECDHGAVGANLDVGLANERHARPSERERRWPPRGYLVREHLHHRRERGRQSATSPGAVHG